MASLYIYNYIYIHRLRYIDIYIYMTIKVKGVEHDYLGDLRSNALTTILEMPKAL